MFIKLLVVYLHCIRNTKTNTIMSKISEIIKQFERPNFPFKPEKDFYKAVGVSKKRFWQIYKGEASNVQVIELQRIADYFKVNLTELL